MPSVAHARPAPALTPDGPGSWDLEIPTGAPHGPAVRALLAATPDDAVPMYLDPTPAGIRVKLQTPAAYGDGLDLNVSLPAVLALLALVDPDGLDDLAQEFGPRLAAA